MNRPRLPLGTLGAFSRVARFLAPAGAAVLALAAAAAAQGRIPVPGAGAAPAAPAPRAGRAPAPEKQLITMDFQDVEIGVLVKFISEITGRNFILDEKVRGKVTVVSPTKITIEEAYQVFNSILEVKGFTTIPSGPVTKIVPLREAKESGAPLGTQLPRGDQFITQLVPLSFVDATTLVPVLQPMVSKDGLISAYDPSNMLLLIDSASNIDRLLSVISELDIELPERGMEIIPLKNAYAENVAATLQDVLEASEDQATQAPAQPVRRAARGAAQAATGGTPSPKAFRVLADERTNSVIALASPGQMRQIKNLVKELDRDLPGVSRINVYALKYANASEMVEVLSELISDGGSGGLRSGTGGIGPGGLNTRRTTRQQLRQNSSMRSNRSGRFGNTLGQQLGGGGGGNQQGGGGPAAPSSASGSGGEFVGEVRVTADPYTNSLIISAGAQDYDVLKRVIAELDVPRRQVFVEAIILELSLDKSRQLGFEYQGGLGLNDQGIGLGRLNLANLNTAITQPGALSGLVLAAASNQTVTLPDGSKVPAQVALFTALQSDTDVNILSAPTILTSDNQEAEILVGQNIPFIASRATSETNLSNTFATVDRQDVGITLRLTPQISQGDVVRLDIYEEVSAVVPNPPVDANIAGPTTSVRSTSTTIVAKSGHTVALGGLISDNTSLSQSKIPFIGDIPVVGNLFKLDDNRKNKINLLIFLTPHVVHDESDLQQVSTQERDRFKRYLAQQKNQPQRREQLDRPSWNAATSGTRPLLGGSSVVRPAATPYPGSDTAPILRPPSSYPAPAYEPFSSQPIPTPAPRPYSSSAPLVAPTPMSQAAISRPVQPPPASALGIPTTGHRFVVLLSLYEKGTPPPELETTNGFLTLYAPADAGDFFAKGGTYAYESPRYEAKYSCLEVFASGNEALSVYPEGRAIERWGGAVVRWKPISADQMRQIVAGSSPWKKTTN